MRGRWQGGGLGGDGAVELAGVGAAAVPVLAQRLPLELRHLGEEVDEGGVDGGGSAVAADALALWFVET